MNTATELNTASVATHEVERSRGQDGKRPLTLITKLNLGFDRKELRISTSKASRGGIEVEASVVTISQCGRFHSSAHGRNGDFFRRVDGRPQKGTEKALLDLHMVGLAQLESLTAAAKAHYAR